jgi:hypothetical protein
MGTYSDALEAAKKRAIDKKIGGTIAMDDEAYLKSLVEYASGSTKVTVGASGLQFFIIKGGGEGFLDAWYSGKDASRRISHGPTTAHKVGTEMIFDDNDLLAVFTKSGKLIGSALLQRPISIKHPNIWSEHTANRIYDAWDGRSVSIYRNTSFDIKYYGLAVADKLGWYASGAVRVDLHKQEATNGCIFIVDPNTPLYSNPTALNLFEPQLIKDIQTEIAAKVKLNIGTMHVIEIT